MAKKDLFRADTVIGDEDEGLVIRKKAAIRIGTIPELIAGGRSKPLSNKACGIGRDRSNAIIVADQKVSKFHALLTFNKGRVQIRDSGSRNGTLVNGKPISSEKQVTLKAGDILRLGDTEIVISE